jgi:hypothetical protein
MLIHLMEVAIMENPLVVTGVVAGKGLKASCRVRVQVLTGPFLADSPFTECAIEEAPSEVPDGLYELRFLNQAALVRHEDGLWTEGIPWESAT